MKNRYFHISYQWPPGCRGGVQVTVAVPDDGRSTAEMAKVAIERLTKHVGQELMVIECNKLPSNYKPRGNEIE
jgi:hypothetical protein